jgi:transposase
VLATLNAEIAATQRRIREHIDHDPDLRQRRDLLDTIPGLGNARSRVLLAALGDVHRFDNARSVAAFAGLSPKEHQSGKWKGHTRLSKTGDVLLRKALYLPAIVARRHNPLIRAFCERLKAQGKKVNSSWAPPRASSSSSPTAPSNPVNHSIPILGLHRGS